MFTLHWHLRKIRLNEMITATAKECNKDRTFHGWDKGIPLNKNYKSHKIKGYKGVQISLSDRKKMGTGSSKTDETSHARTYNKHEDNYKWRVPCDFKKSSINT